MNRLFPPTSFEIGTAATTQEREDINISILVKNHAALETARYSGCRVVIESRPDPITPASQWHIRHRFGAAIHRLWRSQRADPDAKEKNSRPGISSW